MSGTAGDPPAEGAWPPQPRPASSAWLLAAALALPAALPYLAHLARAATQGLLPTGFLVYDMAFYMATAREHFDDGGFRLLYGLPFSPAYSTPAIYFQPHTLLLGLAWRATGWDPGLVFVLFGAAAAVACARGAVALYREIAGLADRADRLGLLAFVWGGGLLALTGAVGAALRGDSAALATFEALVSRDPWDGWWFLNLGRNLVFPTEALYHALFFGAVLGLLRRRWAMAALAALALVLTHPFTGVELMAILLAWLAVEWRAAPGTVPPRFALACGAIVAVQLAYYGAFLRRFEEHRVVVQQYSLPWLLDDASLLPAYLPVAALAAWNFRTVAGARRFLGRPAHRLLVVWFLVALALAKHDLVLRPVMPLHFTRGYVWMPLFLMGAPALTGWLRRGLAPPTRAARRLAVVAVLALLLADNALWLGTYPWRPSGWQQAIFLHPAERDVLAFLATQPPGSAVVAARTRKLGYLTTVYTPLRTWYAHHTGTPHAEARAAELGRFFATGQAPAGWRGRRVLVVALREDAAPASGAWGTPVYANAGFAVFRREPSAGGGG